VTAYRVEHRGPSGSFAGADGTPKSGNAGVRDWADRVGLSPLTTTEAACVLTVLAVGLR